jgi:DNA-binding transcriptional LysR family regulator
VGLTEAGAAFLARLRPAATEINEALEAMASLRQRPAGNLRLSVPRIALDLVIAPVLPEFRRLYPDVRVEIEVDDSSIDLAAGRFDAGVRIGGFIERDMIAVRLTPDFRSSILGAPSYFAARGRPRSPHDLLSHECIRYRFPTSREVYRRVERRKPGAGSRAGVARVRNRPRSAAAPALPELPQPRQRAAPTRPESAACDERPARSRRPRCRGDEL